MNNLIKLIMNKHNLDYNEATSVFDLVKKNCKDEDFYSEFINELKIFHDKKNTANWITSADSILSEALEEIYIEDNISNDEFSDILISKYIEENSNLLEISNSLYIAWED